MPELQFIGKEFVYNHHLTVPYRPLIAHPDKGIGEGSLDDNLIIHGDNLHALKALLPRYAGKVDCIFIDPPYNTGNEGWSYNDNVNSPLIKEWLSCNPINTEDMLRHDKWCCMMWPRLRLLWELLSDKGSLWVTLDDNEIHRGRAILDEVFGEDNCVGQLAWQKRTSRENRATLSPSIDHVLLYTKALPDTWRLFRHLLTPNSHTEQSDEDAPDGHESPGGTIPFSAQGFRKNQVYKITTPTGLVLDPPKGRCWGATEPEFRKLLSEGRIYWPKNGNGRPRVKPIEGRVVSLVPNTLWLAKEVGDTEDSKKALMAVFSDREELGIHAPKPRQLVERIVQISTTPDSIVLDSFAGSGTTGEAVLARNHSDNGNRRFILVECEDYADSLTAERVRRVIKGYPYKGTQKETLQETKLSWANLQKADDLVQGAKNTALMFEGSYDRVETKVEDGILRVTGIRKVDETAPGLGGTFTYCTLGEPIDLDKILQGEAMPSYENMAAWLVHTAFGKTVPTSADHRGEGIGEWYVGETDAYHVWLIYRPDKAFLQAKESALTLEAAEAISKAKPGKPSLVFASSKYVGKKYLDALTPRVEYAPLPFALYRLERG